MKGVRIYKHKHFELFLTRNTVTIIHPKEQVIVRYKQTEEEVDKLSEVMDKGPPNTKAKAFNHALWLGVHSVTELVFMEEE